MDLLEDLITHLATSIAPGGDDNLLGFEIDAAVYFGKHRAVDGVRARRTTTAQELIRVQMTLGKKLKSVEGAVDAVLQGFDRVAYTHFRASSVGRFREAVRLRFVTVVTSHNYFVSGTVLALGSRYAALTAALERPLPPLPGGIPEWAAVADTFTAG
jgi:hypothetical protein